MFLPLLVDRPEEHERRHELRILDQGGLIFLRRLVHLPRLKIQRRQIHIGHRQRFVQLDRFLEGRFGSLDVLGLQPELAHQVMDQGILGLGLKLARDALPGLDRLAFRQVDGHNLGERLDDAGIGSQRLLEIGQRFRVLLLGAGDQAKAVQNGRLLRQCLQDRLEGLLSLGEIALAEVGVAQNGRRLHIPSIEADRRRGFLDGKVERSSGQMDGSQRGPRFGQVGAEFNRLS